MHHYESLGGRSPYNDLTMRQATALRSRSSAGRRSRRSGRGWDAQHAAVYRRGACANWRAEESRRAFGLVLAAHRSEASWERYQVNVADARASRWTGSPKSNTPPPGTTTRCSSRLSQIGCASAARASRRRLRMCRAHLHRAQHPGRDGGARALRRTRSTSRHGWSQRRSASRIGARFSEPQRRSARSVARTRYRCGAAQNERTRAVLVMPTGFPLRPCRGALRSRCRGGANRARDGRHRWCGQRPSATIRALSR